MIRNEINGIHFLEFELFKQFPKLQCQIFLRHGGFSSLKFGSLNLSYTVGDDRDKVQANEKKILSILGLKNLVRGKLTHGKTVIQAKLEENVNLSYDGIATNQLNLGLLITHADCQAACFYDPVNHVVANVHSGWRGNVQNIYAETVSFMKKTYGTKPENLYVGIAPSLGPDDAEFINYKNELPISFWNYQVKPHHFDFWQISKMQLKACGILCPHIQIASISTFSNHQDYFSYRLENITGRNATVVALL
jgi:hypothetical protein